MRDVRKIKYVNTHASLTAVVRVRYKDLVTWEAVLGIYDSATSSAECDFGGLMTIGSLHTHETSLAASVTFFVIGGA